MTRVPPAAMDEDAAWALVRGALARRAQAHEAEPSATAASSARATPSAPTASAPATPAARDLLDLYLPLVGAPDLVIGQLGQSLDGRIATASGHSHYVTGREDIRRLHRLRALVDAVIVGAGTVAVDDPRLTVRDVEGENPVRVVLDPDGRLGAERRVFSDGAARTLVIVKEGMASESRSAEVIHLPTDGRDGRDGRDGPDSPDLPDGFDPAAILSALRARGLRRVLVEGGGVTVSRFLEAGVLDRLHVTVAPLLIGSGRPALTLPPVATLEGALRPRCRHFHLGEDLLFDLDLRHLG